MQQVGRRIIVRHCDEERITWQQNHDFWRLTTWSICCGLTACEVMSSSMATC
jgi:hypothetical protein